MDLLSVAKAPCVPFSTRPRSGLRRTPHTKRVLHCAAGPTPEKNRLNGLSQELLKACAPFAAAVLLLAQANPATAETQFQESLRRQQEFLSGNKSGGLDSFFKKGAGAVQESTKDVTSSLPFGKSDAGDAVESAKSAAGDAASNAQSAAKAAAPDDASKGGKEAASNIVEGAKDVVGSSQKEAEVAGTGDASSSGRGLTSKAADAAKSAAKDVQDAAPSPGGSPVDAAKSAVKDAAPASLSSPVDAAKSAVQDASPAPVSSPVDTALDTAKSAADDASSSAASVTPASSPTNSEKPIAENSSEKVSNPIDANTANAGQARTDTPISVPNFFNNFLGIEGKPGPAPPSQLEEKVPKGAAPLPEQPLPEPESKQLGVDSAGGKVQDTARGSGPLDLFGGGKSGQSPSQKADDLVEEAKKPNPQSSFLGGLFGINDVGKDVPKPPDFGLSGSSSLPTKNEVGQIGEQLEAPQPSEVDEAGNLPEKSPGEENKLPEQPAPEPSAPEDLGKDTPGGKTGSTQSGGGILDFFGGSSSQPSQPATSTDPVSFQPHSNNPVSLVADAADKLRSPQPSDINEGGVRPDRPSGEGNQPSPGAGSGAEQDVGRDKDKDTGNLFDFFGRATPQSALPAPQPQRLPVGMTYNNSELLTFVKEKVAAPQPSELEESFPESAPGRELAPEEQPRPEPASKQLPQDTAGGETQDTKRGGGSLDFFGGSDSGDAVETAEKNVEKAKSASDKLKPDEAKVGLNLSNNSGNAVAEVAEVEAPEDTTKVTAIGAGLSLLLAILIFTIQPQAESHH